jgi:hypothetical protein
MLRTALYVVGGVLALGGAALLFAGCSAAIAAGWLIAWGLILVGGLAIERWRYKPMSEARPGPDWQMTGERFIDPETGKIVTVYFHPRTGERRYVAG